MSSGTSSTRIAGLGAIFGIIAGLVMGGIGYLLPIPMMMDNPPFFINAMEMWSVSSPVATGWVLLIFTSAVIGAIFGLLTTKVAILNVRTPARAALLGVIAGAVIWLVLFLPVEIPPMPGLFSMGNFLVESLGYNIVFGLVLAMLMWAASWRGTKPVPPS